MDVNGVFLPSLQRLQQLPYQPRFHPPRLLRVRQVAHDGLQPRVVISPEVHHRPPLDAAARGGGPGTLLTGVVALLCLWLFLWMILSIVRERVWGALLGVGRGFGIVAGTCYSEYMNGAYGLQDNLIEQIGNLSSIGSDTLNNLMTLWAEEFQKIYPNVNIQIQGAGSSTPDQDGTGMDRGADTTLAMPPA